MLASDERVKENIEPIGKSFDKQTIYKFNYIGDPTARIGLMAQEVEKKHPGAVKDINGTKAVDYNKATAKSAELGAHRQHRAIGGGVGIGNGTSGLEGYSGLQSGLAPYFAQSPQVNVPAVHFPTINLDPQKNTAQQQQQDQQAKQWTDFGTALSKNNVGGQLDQALFADFGGGGADFAHGGRIHRDDGGSVQDANDAFLANNQGFGLGIIPPANAAIAPSDKWQPSIETAPQKLIQDRFPPSPPEATTMGAQSATPGSGQYVEMGYDGRPIGAPQAPVRDPALVQQAAIRSPAQTPPPLQRLPLNRPPLQAQHRPLPQLRSQLPHH